MSGLARFAWFTLAWNVAVVVFGAFVRATGSGAGCGRSWPTCQGEIVPGATETATVIEYTHRLTSGLALVAVLVLLIWAWRATPPGAPLRKGAVWSAVTIIGEAAIGAMIVLAAWVGNDASVARAISVPLHLVNTLLLLAALTLTAWWASGAGKLDFSIDRRLFRLVIAAGAGVLATGATGAVAALADTLFPVESLRAGIIDDFSATSNFLTRLRVLHPVVAMTVGTFIGYVAWTRGVDGAGRQRRFALAVLAVVITQVFAGIANVLLLTPVWMQLLHLFLADALWIAFVLFAAASFERRPIDQAAPDSSPPRRATAT